MLYLIHCANHQELTYRGGQGQILHLEADLYGTIAWAKQNSRRWAFTLSNAGAYYFEDRSSITNLGELDWAAIATSKWSGIGVPPTTKEGKQAEFLVEEYFPWRLVERIGVQSRPTAYQATNALSGAAHRPVIELRTDWYY